jgi:uncharacterized protein YcfJ
MLRIFIGSLFLCLLMQADTLHLKSGKTIEGTYLGGDARNLRFDTGDRVQTFPINDVADIRFGSSAVESGALAPTPAAVAPATRTATPKPMSQTRATTSTPSARSAPIEIAAGTPIVVRLINDVDSERDTIGKTFQASVDEPVVMGERTVIAKGADVVLKLTEDKQSGKLSGKTELTLDVVSVQVNGKMVDVMTEEVSRSSTSRTSKTGQVVGGGAALGAIIGAIAGGGKGAAIGALSGAAAGGAVQVITKGEKVKIPSETRLTFTLQQPLTT